MLMRSLVIAGLAAVVASQVPGLFGLTDLSATDAELAPAPTAVSVEAAAAPGTAMLRAGVNGHFNGSFRLNGKPVEGMVDTGASTVAINESTARRLGFTANQLDFRHSVRTANGQTEAAHVMLSSVEVGSVRVRNVDALVLRDAALSSTLVGMSFLNKLGTYKVDAGSLYLTQ
ncbi:MAG: TIGR02281 family clan AA aspartic protease [Pseudorhizobium sp.]